MAQGITSVVQASQTEFVTGVGNSTINFRMTVSETYNVTTRTSNLHFSNLQMLLAGGDRYYTGYLNGQVRLKISGTTYATVIDASSLHGAIHAQMSSSAWQTFVDDDAGGVNWSADVNNIPHNPDGSLSVVVDFVNLSIENTEGTHFREVKVNDDITVNLTTIPYEYTLTLSVGSHASGTVTLQTSPYRTAGGTLSNGAKIYSGETIKVTFSASAGYEASAKVNGAAVSSGAVKTVSGNMAVVITARALGLVYIAGQAYQAYVYTGTAWDLVAPYIFAGNAWNIY